jgi:hypothetical protein
LVSKEPLPADIPPEAVAFLEEIGYREADALKPGDMPPPLRLTRMDSGEMVRIPPESAGLPTVLIFGSYT